MNRLIIVGASGHGKVVADIAALNGYEDIVFLDGNPEIKSCMGYPVIGSDKMLEDIAGDVFVAIGNCKIREQLMSHYNNRFFPVLIHPSAVISKFVQIDVGTVVMAGAVINPDTKVGKGVIVNTSCSIDHDCLIGDYAHIAVGAHLCGSVRVGNNAWVGSGATIINNIEICSESFIGAGAVVVKNLLDAGTYVGVPARRIK